LDITAISAPQNRIKNLKDFNMRSWLGNRLRGGSTSMPHSFEQETAAMQDALTAAAHIMADDLELADEKLQAGDSAFHKVSSPFLRNGHLQTSRLDSE
jgi:hypothetical protein